MSQSQSATILANLRMKMDENMKLHTENKKTIKSILKSLKTIDPVKAEPIRKQLESELINVEENIRSSKQEKKELAKLVKAHKAEMNATAKRKIKGGTWTRRRRHH